MALDNTPEAFETSGLQFHIERGTQVLDSNGASLGTVQQIVMDRDTGVLRSLVVKSAEDEREYEIATDYVEQSTSAAAVRLTSGGHRVLDDASIAKPYHPEQYVPVEEEQAVDQDIAAQETIQTKHPVVTDIEEDAATVMLPPHEPGALAQGELAAPPDRTAPGAGKTPIEQGANIAPASALSSIVADDISGEGMKVAEAAPDGGQATTMDAATTPLPSQGVAGVVPASAQPPAPLAEGAAPTSLSPTPTSTLSPVPEGDQPFSTADMRDIVSTIANAGQTGAVVPTRIELPAEGETSPQSPVQPAALFSPEDEPTPALPRPLLIGIGIGALALAGGIALVVILRARRQRQRTLVERVNAKADDVTESAILTAGELSRSLSQAAKNVTSTAQTLAGTASARASDLTRQGQALAAQGRDVATARAGDLSSRSMDIASRARALAAARASDLTRQSQTLAQQTRDTSAGATSSLHDWVSNVQSRLGSRYDWFRRGVVVGGAAQATADATLASVRALRRQASGSKPAIDGSVDRAATADVVEVRPDRLRLQLPFGRYKLQPVPDDGTTDDED